MDREPVELTLDISVATTALQQARLEPWFRSRRRQLFGSEEPLGSDEAVRSFLEPLLVYLKTEGAGKLAKAQGPEPCLWLNPRWPAVAAFRPFVPEGTHFLEERFGRPIPTCGQEPYEQLARDIQEASLATGFQPRDLLGHLLLDDPKRLILPPLKIRRQVRWLPGEYDLPPIVRLVVEFSRDITHDDLKKLRNALKEAFADERNDEHLLLRELVEAQCSQISADPRTCSSRVKVFRPVAEELSALTGKHVSAEACLSRWRRMVQAEERARQSAPRP